MNYTAKLDLLRIHGASVHPIKGAKETKNCLIIPLDDSGLYAGQKGVYLNVSVFERKGPAQYGDWTHSIRLNVDGEIYKSMTDDEKKAIGTAVFFHPLKKVNATGTTRQAASGNGVSPTRATSICSVPLTAPTRKEEENESINYYRGLCNAGAGKDAQGQRI